MKKTSDVLFSFIPQHPILPLLSPILMGYNESRYRMFQRKHTRRSTMEDLEKQDPYRIEMMRTLWENNFRGTIFDYRDSYVATVRLIFSIPLDREEVPENAPVVDPMIFVLVEDTVLKPIEVVAFEEAMTPILAKKLASNVFTPDRIVYFYPSPAEGAETK